MFCRRWLRWGLGEGGRDGRADELEGAALDGGGFGEGGDDVNPPGESGDSILIETMLPHRYSNRYRRFLPISRAAYLRSIHTSADC